ncbi:MAG: N-acetylmuramoyl-L-alanine amidase [Clostridiaceae bacterium]|jgi:N-acetylmuramoyl-L-alanine amidase|nr:N-acetylmuramoyl-L-alanine amidase [Clostridiaceae bacterium]
MKRYFHTILIFILVYSILPIGSIISFAEEVNIAKANMGVLTQVNYSEYEDYEVVELAISGFKGYRSFELADPLRIVIDLDSTELSGKERTIQAEGKLVERVRYAQFTHTTARVVLDVKEGYDYSIENSDSGLNVYVAKKLPQEELNAKKAIMFSNQKGIKFFRDESGEGLSLTLGKYKGYSVSRQTNPQRLTLTVPDAGIIGTDAYFNVDGSQIKSVSYKKTGKTGAGIILNLNDQYQYRFEESEDQLVMRLDKPSFKNIMYYNSDDRVYFTLDNAMLTQGDKDLQKLYEAKYDLSKRLYTITFPTEQADLGEGILDINDSYLRYFEVRTNAEEGTTSLVFRGKSKISYMVYTRSSGVTAITLIKPGSGSKMPVVIDPGHGGTAIGTAYGRLTEKELNLDIAKRVNALLEEKGIVTYMMRAEDSNVDNYERAYIANMLNAKLFLSIHINGVNNRNVDGTMTLYCPSDNSGFTGKDFSEIIQKNLLSVLKATDRGLRSRSDLIVLRETEMPAAIAEIAFITNSADRARLQRESFRQNAAQGLCDSVDQALQIMK